MGWIWVVGRLQGSLSFRFVKTWLITALVNFHAMRGDMADEARDSISSEEVTFFFFEVTFTPTTVLPNCPCPGDRGSLGQCDATRPSKQPRPFTHSPCNSGGSNFVQADWKWNFPAITKSAKQTGASAKCSSSTRPTPALWGGQTITILCNLNTWKLFRWWTTTTESQESPQQPALKQRFCFHKYLATRWEKIHQVPPPLYWDLYPAVSSSAGSSLLCVLPGSPDPTGSPSQVLRGRRPSQSLEKLPPAPPSPHTHSDKGGKWKWIQFNIRCEFSNYMSIRW